MKPTDRFYDFLEDFRSPFARDRDRVIHCSSFRRLEYKTQVFLNHEGDYFRTRLTHSLEVSQIARTIAHTLGLNDILAETIALSHDLGHTPFGHVGGDTLDELLKEDGRVFGFEHNFQSFRVLTKLEKRYKDFDGLNLTYATLEGVLKHSYPYQKAFSSHLFESFSLDKHPSFEAMVVDFADEIAYTSHDIDDGIHYKLISFEDIIENTLVQKINDIVEKNDNIYRNEKLYRQRFVSTLIRVLVEDFITHSKDTISQFPSTPQSSLIDATQSLDIGFSKKIARDMKLLKKLLFKKLYHHKDIVRNMYAGSRCIKGLYRAFKENHHLLPQEHIELMEKREPKRVISDYIASMTDRYALKLYNQLYGRGLKS
ncbi:MAG: deoxyguanosinetriphosphate triphosphohydrolase [Sulfurovum sp. AS07-7]|nr:MAG: deoxyguanosinetriphosphate triphosphohydrolase [Sulfurovum sp. AS07-7]